MHQVENVNEENVEKKSARLGVFLVHLVLMLDSVGTSEFWAQWVDLRSAETRRLQTPDALCTTDLHWHLNIAKAEFPDKDIAPRDPRRTLWMHLGSRCHDAK